MPKVRGKNDGKNNKSIKKRENGEGEVIVPGVLIGWAVSKNGRSGLLIADKTKQQPVGRIEI